MAAGAYVQLLGQPGVRVGGKLIDFLPNKRFQLLAYLAYQNDWVSRDKLAFLFWPDETDHTARHNLRQLLKYLRKLDWLSGLEADEQRLRWLVETDAATLKEALLSGDVEKTLLLYRGPLMPHLEGNGEGEFGEWLAMEREGFHGRWREVLFSKVVELDSTGEHERAATLLRHLLERDPLDEEGLQAYIRAALKAGHREQAFSAYRAFAKRLQTELEIEPTSATLQLAKEIKEAPPTPPPHREVIAAAQPLSVPNRSAAVATSTEVVPSLPKPTTSFVGRDLELAEVAHLLSQEDCRLLTLIGLGGVGKTRLVLQATQEVGKNYPDGVYFVALDSLVSASSIPTTLAATLGTELQGLEEPLTQISRFLKNKQILLLLDNYEHLLEGATIASKLLQACPKLTLLVTSRERLDLEEEWLLPVQGLSYPTDTSSLEKASAHDAVQLFVRRAQRVLPSFSLTEVGLPHVLQICGLVQGFPLGIELAAAWVRAMPVAEIAQEIRQNYDFLSSTSRNLTDRHRSIRAAFEHSWRLLSDTEQSVLRKLSVFKGGFRKEAATYVAGASYTVLAALLDKSLLHVTVGGRYDMHPIIYHYTQEKLSEQRQKKSRTHDKHLGYYLALAEQAEAQLRGPELTRWLDRLEVEHSNLRAALEWTEASGHAGLGLRLAGALRPFWATHGHLHEGRERLARALLQQGASKQPLARAKALNGAGLLARYQGDCASARSLHEESLMIRRKLGDKWGVADTLFCLGFLAYDQTDYDAARPAFDESLAIRQELGDKKGIADSIFGLGYIALDQGVYDLARSIFEESLTIRREVGDRRGIAHSLIGFGHCAIALADYASARSHFEESLAIYQEAGDKRGIASSLDGLAALSAVGGKAEQAAHLFGAGEAIRESIGAPLLLSNLPRYERYVATAHAQLDKAAFSIAWAQGRLMPLEQVFKVALETNGRQRT